LLASGNTAGVVRPYLYNERDARVVRRWFGVVLAGVGALGLLGSLYLVWFELRLYSWQGGCCDRDIDNPFSPLTPWPWDAHKYDFAFPGAGIYLPVAIAAAVAGIAAVSSMSGRRGHRRMSKIIIGAGALACILIGIAAILAFNVDTPTGYEADIIVVRMAPMLGLVAGVVCAAAIVVGGIVDYLSPLSDG